MKKQKRQGKTREDKANNILRRIANLDKVKQQTVRRFDNAKQETTRRYQSREGKARDDKANQQTIVQNKNLQGNIRGNGKEETRMRNRDDKAKQETIRQNHGQAC